MRCGRFLKIIHFLLVASFFPRGKWGSANSKPIHMFMLHKIKNPKENMAIGQRCSEKRNDTEYKSKIDTTSKTNI